VRRFIETAAVKLEKDTPLEALAALRGAEAAVYAAHRKDVEDAAPVSWTAPAPALVPPAAQSSATAAMRMGVEKKMAWRKLGMHVGGLTERIRRNYFRPGVYSGPNEPARLSARLR
jgi:hypothetical protein